MFGNEKNPQHQPIVSNGFTGDLISNTTLTNNGTSMGFVGAEGVKTGTAVNGAGNGGGGGKTGTTMNTMKSEFLLFFFCDSI